MKMNHPGPGPLAPLPDEDPAQGLSLLRRHPPGEPETALPLDQGGELTYLRRDQRDIADVQVAPMRRFRHDAEALGDAAPTVAPLARQGTDVRPAPDRSAEPAREVEGLRA